MIYCKSLVCGVLIYDMRGRRGPNLVLGRITADKSFGRMMCVCGDIETHTH